MANHQNRLREFAKVCAAIALGLLLVQLAYVAIYYQRIFPASSDVVIYGTYGCGITTALREDLKAQGVPFTFVAVDGFLPNQEMHYFLQNIPHEVPKLGYVQYPVVRVDGRLLERPEHGLVVRLRDEALASSP